MEKQLTRSKTNRMLGGVLGGLGEYFAIDPVLVRVLFIFATCVTGFVPGVVAYVIALVIMPEAPTNTPGESGRVA